MARYELTRSPFDPFAATYLRAGITLSRQGDVLAYASERPSSPPRTFASRAASEEHAARIERTLHEAWLRAHFRVVDAAAITRGNELPPRDKLWETILLSPADDTAWKEYAQTLTERGEMHDLTELPDEIDEPLDPEVTRLRHGFLTAASISPLQPAEDWDLPGCLIETLRHPRASFLEELTLPYAKFDETIEALTILAPITVRKLVVGKRFGHRDINDDAYPEMEEVGDATPVFIALSRLEDVRLRVGRLHLETLDAPSLRALTIETDTLSPQTVRAISAASLPKLEHLALWFGFSDELPGRRASVDDLASLFSGAGVPSLRSLSLSHTRLSDGLCTGLSRAPLAAQLETLDLSKGNLTMSGARLLAESRDTFARLRRLDVSANGLTEEARELLERTYEEVVCSWQYHPSWWSPDHPDSSAR